MNSALGAGLFELINVPLCQNSENIFEKILKSYLLEEENEGSEYRIKNIFHLGIEFEGKIKLNTETNQFISVNLWPIKGVLESDLATELHKSLCEKLEEAHGKPGQKVMITNADTGPREWPAVIWIVGEEVIYINIQDYGKHTVWNINRVLRSNLEKETIDGDLFWKKALDKVETQTNKEKFIKESPDFDQGMQKREAIESNSLYFESKPKKDSPQHLDMIRNMNNLSIQMHWIIILLVFLLIIIIIYYKKLRR